MTFSIVHRVSDALVEYGDQVQALRNKAGYSLYSKVAYPNLPDDRRVPIIAEIGMADLYGDPVERLIYPDDIREYGDMPPLYAYGSNTPRTADIRSIQKVDGSLNVTEGYIHHGVYLLVYVNVPFIYPLGFVLGEMVKAATLRRGNPNQYGGETRPYRHMTQAELLPMGTFDLVFGKKACPNM